MFSSVALSGLLRMIWSNPFLRAALIFIGVLLALKLFYEWAEGEGRGQVQQQVDMATYEETVRQLNVFRDAEQNARQRAQNDEALRLAAEAELARLRQQIRERPVTCDGDLFDQSDIDRLCRLRTGSDCSNQS